MTSEREPTIMLLPVAAGDFDELSELRIAAMRESLERVGRFDPTRARERLRSTFSPEHTHFIVSEKEKIGFYTARPSLDGLCLDHLYLLPEFQNRGFGGAVLKKLFEQADHSGVPVLVGALKQSASNRFYQRHGFVKTNEAEWDVYYIRPPSRAPSVGRAEIDSRAKTFVFDADGVICPGENFSVFLERVHQIPRERVGPFFAGPFSECVLGLRDLKEAIAPYAAEWGWRESIEDLLAFWFQCEDVISSEVMERVRSLRKKGHTCVLGTNQEKYRSRYLRYKMRLAEEFDHIFVSCELGVAKPSAAFFSAIQENLGVPSDSLCLIDDSEINVAAARLAGWRGVWYRGLNDLAAIEGTADDV